MCEDIDKVKERVEASDMVLVGLGAGMECSWNQLLEDSRYQQIEQEIEGKAEMRWIVPFLQLMSIREKRDAGLDAAYENLFSLISEKNYFVVSLCTDDYIYSHPFSKDRLVTPCGGFRRMQCDQNCKGKLGEITEKVYQEVKSYYRGEKLLSELKEPRCEDCGSSLRFNQMGVSRYAEEGYLAQWETYTKWLTGTVNRKLCVLELGAGMEFPTVIRFPFEKVVFYNKKAFMYRIHPALYQVGAEIAERGKGIKEDPAAFLREMS